MLHVVTLVLKWNFLFFLRVINFVSCRRGFRADELACLVAGKTVHGAGHEENSGRGDGLAGALEHGGAAHTAKRVHPAAWGWIGSVPRGAADRGASGARDGKAVGGRQNESV